MRGESSSDWYRAEAVQHRTSSEPPDESRKCWQQMKYSETYLSTHFFFAAGELLTDGAWVLASSYNLNTVIIIKQSIHCPTTALVDTSEHE
jgi:hypothetical protein